MISFKLKESATASKRTLVRGANTEFSLDSSDNTDNKQHVEWIGPSQKDIKAGKGKLVIPIPDEFKIQTTSREHSNIQFVQDNLTSTEQTKTYGLVKSITNSNIKHSSRPLLSIHKTRKGEPNEHDAYIQDISNLPEATNIDDYAQVPVEQYGEALLRGMGWRDGEALSLSGPKEPILPKSRNMGRLGLGADPEKVISLKRK